MQRCVHGQDQCLRWFTSFGPHNICGVSDLELELGIYIVNNIIGPLEPIHINLISLPLTVRLDKYWNLLWSLVCIWTHILFVKMIMVLGLYLGIHKEDQHDFYLQDTILCDMGMYKKETEQDSATRSSPLLIHRSHVGRHQIIEWEIWCLFFRFLRQDLV